MSELLSITATGLAFFLAALTSVLSVLSIALVLHWGHKREQGLMPYIFYPTFLIIALTTILSGRNLYLAAELSDPMLIGRHSILVWAGRANSLFMLFAACERIARRFLSSGYKPHATILLMCALWLYFFTNIVSSGFLGAHPTFSHQYLYSILAGSASLLLSEKEGDTAIRVARNSLLMFISLSAVVWLLRPELVVSNNYKGLIPGFSLRYYGLNSHPNSFGPVIVVFLICLWSRGYETRWFNIFSWGIGLTSLVLTQSKTSWVAFAICAFSIGYYRYGDFLKQRIFDFKRPQLAAIVISLAMVSIGLFGFALMFTPFGETIYTFFLSREGDTLLSLSGRDQIWDAAVQEWRRHPLFGYGLTIWDEHYRAQIGIQSALSAHSQFYQSLSSSGIVGVIGLIIYYITLLVFTLKTSKASKGLSMALFLILSVRSISETPLAIEDLGPELLPHLLLLMVIASHFRSGKLTHFSPSVTSKYSFDSARGLT